MRDEAADEDGDDAEVLHEITLLADVIDLANASEDRVPVIVLDEVLNRP